MVVTVAFSHSWPWFHCGVVWNFSLFRGRKIALYVSAFSCPLRGSCPVCVSMVTFFLLRILVIVLLWTLPPRCLRLKG